MITKENFKSLLRDLEFTPLSGKDKGIYLKRIGDYELRVNFNTEKLIYPEKDGMKIHERQTCNMSDNENFVVFECVHRLLVKGYPPANIELEPKWQLGRGASGGRADILVRDYDGKAYLVIECKTWGEEFDREWKNMLLYGGQLFSYAQQIRSTQFVCLYASGFEDGQILKIHHIIALRDNVGYLKSLKAPLSFAQATDVQALHKAWYVTYNHEYETKGIFEEGVSAYAIGEKAHTTADLDEITHEDIQKKYHEFATILRQHNVSGRENAFDKLVNLFLAKIVDEMQNPEELQFYWKGSAFDDYFSLLDRILRLYRDGMRKFLNEEVTYINDSDIRDSFRLFKNDPDATQETIIKYFRQLKFYTNNDFSFLDVHNEHLFIQNSNILLKVVKMIQDIRLKTQSQNQFLGDFFEGFLDQGIKQSEGQFFTPTPIVKFLVSSLPLREMIESDPEPIAVMDYACGAGHFLNEYATQIHAFLEQERLPSYYGQIVGIEKEYRLSKVAKVSAFMYGQEDIKIVYADALGKNDGIQDGKYQVLISNPPYSVKGFLTMLSEEERASFEITGVIDKKSIATNNSIEAFFVERARQLLAPGGVAAIILPSSILSNSGAVYTKAREIILRSFDIVAIVEFGSGTFGKTGTNTIALFLRRKRQRPPIDQHYENRVSAWFSGDFEKDAVFGDAGLLQAYCEHVGYGLDDYKTLLQSRPNQTILDVDAFQMYRTAFDGLSETKSLKTKQFFKKLPEEARQAELNKRFVEYARGIEREKLFYFILACTNPQDVVVVKSPPGTKIKSFLGYEWSSAKGNEGIQYIKPTRADEGGDPIAQRKGINRINTPLFNPLDLEDASKINVMVRSNFSGVCLGESEYVTRLRLIDMIDFSGTDLKKTISLTAIQAEERNGKYPLEAIGTHFEYSNTRVDSSELTVDTYVGVENMLQNREGKRPSDFVPQEGSITKYVPEDVLLSNIRPYLKKIWFSDNTGGCSGDVLVLHPRDDTVLCKYLYYVISQDAFFDYVMQFKKGVKMPRGDKDKILQYKIPVPPRALQREMVAACEAVDEEYSRTRLRVEAHKNRIEQLFEQIEMVAGQGVRLDDAALFEVTIGKRVVETQFVSDGTVPVYSANVFSPFGYVDKLLITEFDVPSVLWGIDGDWQVNYMPENRRFYPTDHCGVLRVKDEKIHPRYLAWALQKAGEARGFSRSLRASIDRVKRLKIDLPDPRSQKEAVTEILELEGQIAAAERTLRELETKRQKVLARYLEG